MRPSLAILLVLCACEEPPTPAAPSEPAEPTETVPAEEAEVGWNVAYRRTGWSLMDDPLLDDRALLFDHTRFDLASGRITAMPSPESPIPLAMVGPDRMLGMAVDGVTLFDRAGERLSERALDGSVAASAWKGDQLFVVHEQYRGRERSQSLVALAMPSLREEWRVVLREHAHMEARGLRFDGEDLVVVVSASCHRGRCEPARLERWEGADPEQRTVVAEGFENVALDATGQAALVVGRPGPGGPDVRVIDTHGELLWRVEGPESSWPQSIALAPGGSVAALLQASAAGLHLRILERASQGAVEAMSFAAAPSGGLSFVGSEEAPMLVVSGQGFAVLRRGPSGDFPLLPYEPSPPEGFRERALPEGPLFGPRRLWQNEAYVSVRAEGLELGELEASLTDDEFAARGFRRVAGVSAEALAEPDRALRVWRDERGRHAEMIVPACHEGVSNSDDYHRLTQTDEALVHVAIGFEPGAPPAEVRPVLRGFFDALGAPTTERSLPELPARNCGI